MTAAGRGPWLALRVEVPADLEDEAAAALGEGCLGVEAAAGAAGATLLRVYLPKNIAISDALAGAEARLRSAGIPAAAGGIRAETVEDGRWVERYQASLRPLALGSRFVVVPGIAAPADSLREPIVLVPGRAFGTGEHPTTRLSAAALERRVRPGERWLDLGTGSGILAVVAARCGAERVEALDTDPEAVAVAAEVVEANGLSGRIRVRRGSADALRDAGLDGVVANVAAAFFAAGSAEIAAALRPGGGAIVSGFLAAESRDVENALRAAGLEVEERGAEEEWGFLAARKGTA